MTVLNRVGRIVNPLKRAHRYANTRYFSAVAESVDFDLDVEWLSHKCEGPRKTSTITREECLRYLKLMTYIRRIEIVSDNYYKKKVIRGFCHLYDGQEAVAVGIEGAITPNDHVITTYRDHGWQFTRGDSVRSIMAEQFGKDTGCSRGKGGSMHLYWPEGNFYGGNGIVGAQVPIGAGVAFACKYFKKPEVCITCYGDGAANQGQVFESMNMAALWKLPCIYVCENNLYGMGTSASRAAACPEFYTRGDYIPGILVDGMNIFHVREATRYAREWALAGKGPMVLEMRTYRYHGHSMSDPGTTYRTRDEVSDMRGTRDPIDKLKKFMTIHNLATEEEIKELEKAVRRDVNEQTTLAEKDGELGLAELFQDIYSTGPPPFVRYANVDESMMLCEDGQYRQMQEADA